MGWCQGPCSGPRFGGRISAPSSLGDPHNKHYRLLLSYIDYTHMHTTHTHTCTHIPPHTHKRTVQYLWFFDWTSMFIMKNPPQALIFIDILCADFVLGKNIVKISSWVICHQAANYPIFCKHLRLWRSRADEYKCTRRHHMYTVSLHLYMHMHLHMRSIRIRWPGFESRDGNISFVRHNILKTDSFWKKVIFKRFI